MPSLVQAMLGAAAERHDGSVHKPHFQYPLAAADVKRAVRALAKKGWCSGLPLD